MRLKPALLKPETYQSSIVCPCLLFNLAAWYLWKGAVGRIAFFCIHKPCRTFHVGNSGVGEVQVSISLYSGLMGLL